MAKSVVRKTFQEVNLISSTLADIGDDVFRFDGSGVLQRITLELANAGRVLSDFAILGKAHPDADFHVLLQGSAWDTPAGNLLEVSGSPNDLADGAEALAVIETGPLYEVKCQASIAGGVRNRGILTATQNATNEKATGELTLAAPAAENYSDGDEVVIGENTYTMVLALSVGPAVPYEVLIGANANASQDNLAAAVNGDAGEGTLYSTGTEASTEVTAVVTTDGTDEILTTTAIERGTAGNSIATTTDASVAVWGDTTLLGGTLETVTCDGEVYTFKHSDNMVDDNDVEIGATKEDTIDNLVVVFNATQTRCQAVRASATMVADANEDISNADGTLIATTETAAQWAWGAATFADAVMTTVTVRATAELEF
jgi:hypothetical protein